MNQKLKVAIIGPGNIGTDLIIKVLRNAKYLEMCAMVGSMPTIAPISRCLALRITLIIRSVPILPEPTMATFSFLLMRGLHRLLPTESRRDRGCRRTAA